MLIDTKAEQRWSARKIFKVKAVLTMAGASPVVARTLDLGSSGMSLALSYPLTLGTKGIIQFDLMTDGKTKPLKTTGTVIYCIYSNGEFKVGFKFQQLDLLVLTAIAKFAA